MSNFQIKTRLFLFQADIDMAEYRANPTATTTRNMPESMDLDKCSEIVPVSRVASNSQRPTWSPGLDPKVALPQVVQLNSLQTSDNNLHMSFESAPTSSNSTQELDDKEALQHYSDDVDQRRCSHRRPWAGFESVYGDRPNFSNARNRANAHAWTRVKGIPRVYQPLMYGSPSPCATDILACDPTVSSMLPGPCERQSKAHMFRLPKAVRFKIWRYALHNTVIHVPGTFNAVGLVRTCQQVHRETFKMIYSQCIFLITEKNSCVFFPQLLLLATGRLHLFQRIVVYSIQLLEADRDRVKECYQTIIRHRRSAIDRAIEHGEDETQSEDSLDPWKITPCLRPEQQFGSWEYKVPIKFKEPLADVRLMWLLTPAYPRIYYITIRERLLELTHNTYVLTAQPSSDLRAQVEKWRIDEEDEWRKTVIERGLSLISDDEYEQEESEQEQSEQEEEWS